MSSDDYNMDCMEFLLAAEWDSTVKPADRDRCGWAANPWVWVIAFERCGQPEEG